MKQQAKRETKKTHTRSISKNYASTHLILAFRFVFFYLFIFVHRNANKNVISIHLLTTAFRPTLLKYVVLFLIPGWLLGSDSNLSIDKIVINHRQTMLNRLQMH